MASEDDCIEAVRQILIQLYGLSEKQLPDNQIGRVEREAIFYLYEGLDKYGNSKPHSLAARIVKRQGNGRAPPKTVTYDHAIPLASLRDELKAATISLNAMRRCLRKFIRGVVITWEENTLLNKAGLRAKLPGGSQPHDMLARYRAVGILFAPEDEALLREQV